MLVLNVVLIVTLCSTALGLPKQLTVGSKGNPGKSCKDIKARGGTVTGNYYIRLGGRTLLVHCDQTTDNGGWTLVYSFTFADIIHFDHGSNAITPRPNWPINGDVPTSTTTPKSETDFNAMDFNLWKELGSHFMIKSNINNWISCSDRSGSLVYWRSGTLKCKIVSNIMGRCQNVVPNAIQVDFYGTGPNIYDWRVDGPSIQAYYNLETWTHGVEWPTFDPCGQDVYPALQYVDLPRGNIYIR